jgi:hypothetical protein
MRRLSIVFVCLFAMAVFVSGAIAQGEKPGSPASATEKGKVEKPKASKATRVYGTVVAYEAGKIIKVKGKKEKEWTFDIAPDAKIKGSVKEGGRVRVLYKTEGGKMVATSISVLTARKAKAEKK